MGQEAKKTWCCTNHHICGGPTSPPAPADPYNCADGFANWQAGWSVGKKAWCCKVHERAAPTRATAARLCPAPRRLRTIAMQALPIGLPAGVHQRRHGAVRMQARVARVTEAV